MVQRLDLPQWDFLPLHGPQSVIVLSGEPDDGFVLAGKPQNKVWLGR